MKDFKFIEHNLIPATLFVLNMSVVHLIYLLFMQHVLSIITFLVFTCTLIMVTGVIIKHKYTMAAASIIYMLILILSL